MGTKTSIYLKAILFVFCANMSIGFTSSAQIDLKENPIALQAFKDKALENVRRLGLYLSVIGNKQRSMAQKDRATKQALLLFASDSTIVEVASLNRERPRQFYISEYLYRLRNLDYTQVDLEWVEFGYVDPEGFIPAPDGNFYATVTIVQRFVGYGEDRNPIYQDITEKDIEVILTPVRVVKEDTEDYEWNLLLGDIAVAEIRSQ